jgi:hypothetical protein
MPAALASEPYVMAAVSREALPAGPARVYFRLQSGRWQTVGIERPQAR